MDLQSIRAKHSLTLEQMADRLGLKSKGYVSDLEKNPATLPRGIALRVYQTFGARIGPLESLTTPEIELLLKLERAA